MRHYDEHTLELFVLNSAKVANLRHEIYEHLSECEGCRSLALQMVEFYTEAEKEFVATTELNPETRNALVRSQRDLTARYRNNKPAVSVRPLTRVERIQYFVQRHPITAGVTSFGFFAGVALLIAFATDSLVFKDSNPLYTRTSMRENVVEVFNSRDEKLWQLAIASDNTGSALDLERFFGVQHTVVADIDGDGENEVLTVQPLSSRNEELARTLRVFDAKRNIRWERSFTKEIKARNREYSSVTYLGFILTGDFSGNGRTEILVTTTSGGRSPSTLLRLDERGNILGEYWHFGSFISGVLMDVNGDGKEEVIFAVSHDLRDEEGEEEACVVVLDPSRILGVAQSTATPVFDMSLSTAELSYVKFPQSDMNPIVLRRGGISNIRPHQVGGEDVISFFFRTTGVEDVPAFEYILSGNLKPIEVKLSNATVQYRNTLIKEGKVTGLIDAAYLNNLKEGIRYWDGSEWRKEVVWVIPSRIIAGTPAEDGQ